MAAPAAAGQFKYDARTIVLHWTTVGLVIALWVLGQSIDWFEKGAPRNTVRSVHIALGLAMAIVYVARLTWRISSGVRNPQPDPGFAGVAARWTHFGLYLLVGIVLVLGLVTEWMRGDLVFGLLRITDFGKPIHDLSEQVMDVHGTAANVLLILAGLHAGGALVHHFLLRDGVLRRMVSGR
jgi:cytochrome b561